MSVPGPPGGLWALSLVLWAFAAAIVGEAVRGTLASWIPNWGEPEPIERFVLDVYLGGAALFLVAALQVGAFVRPVVLGVPVLGGVVVAYRMVRRRRPRPTVPPILRRITEPWGLVAVASALGLFVVEIVAAVPVPTGNTYDSSLLTTYVSLLLQHGNLPLSFRPYATPAILYPQGVTVWLAWAQLDFGLPAARTALLVTPLFLGLAPLSGYVLGRRVVGTAWAGGAFAVALAWLGPSTRALVGGSNDFAIAFPLVLLLAAQSVGWFSGSPPGLGDAVGFGLLLGYSAVINVVGAEWLTPTLVILGVASRPAFGGRAVLWFSRFAAALGASLLAAIPSLYVLVEGATAPGRLAGALGAPSHVAVGIGVAQFIGSIDPFLLRNGDIELSPVPLVRLELIVLLLLGVVALLWVGGGGPTENRWSRFSRWALASGASVVGWLGLQVAAGVAGSPVRVIAFVSSSAEFSLWLFTIFGLVAAVPLAIAFGSIRPEPTAPSPVRVGPARGVPRRGGGGYAPVVFAIVVVVPALVLTPTSLGSVLSTTYHDFSNVTSADFALLDWAAAHVPAGARVLVAPGSAAEFLPGYARGIVLLYPLVPGWSRSNASYALIVRELTNGTLDASGREAIAALAPDLVVVTGNSTVLWRAFWASTLEGATVSPTDPAALFPVVWHAGDAWVFNASACRPASAGCP